MKNLVFCNVDLINKRLHRLHARDVELLSSVPWNHTDSVHEMLSRISFLCEAVFRSSYGVGWP